MRYTLTQGIESCPAAKEIRKSVFMDEQGFQNEFDDIDNDAYHAVLYVNDKYAATGRLFVGSSGNAHIGRVAVLRDFRGMSLGKQVISILEKKALELNFKSIELSAQTRVCSFYAGLGYSPVGEEYLDENCPHIKMIKKLK